MSKKVVTFGEIMLRLAPEGYYRFVQADTFGATYGGGEATVVLSQPLLTHRYQTSETRDWTGSSEFPERGCSRYFFHRPRRRQSRTPFERHPRPSSAIYDRAGSSIYTAAPEDFDWKAILDWSRTVRFARITPALNDGVAAIRPAKGRKRSGA